MSSHQQCLVCTFTADYSLDFCPYNLCYYFFYILFSEVKWAEIFSKVNCELLKMPFVSEQEKEGYFRILLLDE